METRAILYLLFLFSLASINCKNQSISSEEKLTDLEFLNLELEKNYPKGTEIVFERVIDEHNGLNERDSLSYFDTWQFQSILIDTSEVILNLPIFIFECSLKNIENCIDQSKITPTYVANLHFNSINNSVTLSLPINYFSNLNVSLLSPHSSFLEAVFTFEMDNEFIFSIDQESENVLDIYDGNLVGKNRFKFANGFPEVISFSINSGCEFWNFNLYKAHSDNQTMLANVCSEDEIIANVKEEMISWYPHNLNDSFKGVRRFSSDWDVGAIVWNYTSIENWQIDNVSFDPIEFRKEIDFEVTFSATEINKDCTEFGNCIPDNTSVDSNYSAKLILDKNYSKSELIFDFPESMILGSGGRGNLKSADFKFPPNTDIDIFEYRDEIGFFYKFTDRKKFNISAFSNSHSSQWSMKLEIE